MKICFIFIFTVRKTSMASSFQKSFADIRSAFASDFPTNVDITDVNEKGLHMGTLAAVALWLVHRIMDQPSSKKRSKKKSKTVLDIDTLDINTLATYDINAFEDLYTFTPYIKYLAKKSYNELLPAYTATFIRYLFILQKHKLKVITRDAD